MGNKDQRPDLRQFKTLLGTLDPVGLPLAMATLSKEKVNDLQYVPAWERLITTIELPNFPTVGDCKNWQAWRTKRTFSAGVGSTSRPCP